MTSRADTESGSGVASRRAGTSRRGRTRWLPGLLLTVLLVALHGTALGEITNEITAVSPDSASHGTNDLLVTFTLDTDSPLAPPAGDGPQSAVLGTLVGTGITHPSNLTVTAHFSIPACQPVGPLGATLTFAIPGGTLIFSKAAAFTVTAADTGYTITQSISDEAQRNTIAFDGLAFLNGCVGSQSFLPPGKVADYSGFQYLRDNDPTNLGHNTDFVTIIAFNVLTILSSDQVDQLVASAQTQISLINNFGYQRLPLLKAFRRQYDDDLPAGSTGLDSNAVTAYTSRLFQLDGQISYGRARIMGTILRSLTPSQQSAFAALKTLNGVGNWNRLLPDPLQSRQLGPDVNVAVMTYASEMYAWYAGTVESDTYFCPERHGTYFGSFYLKDWPAMGNRNYSINEQLTASAGQDFLAALPAPQAALVTGLVDVQRSALLAIVDTRRAIATLLRGFQTGDTVDSAAVLALSAQYGALDGSLSYSYAMRFSTVAHGLDAGTRAAVTALSDSLGYLPPPGAFLYSAPIAMPSIENTDFLFGAAATAVGGEGPGWDGAHLGLRSMPNPASGSVVVHFYLPGAGQASVAVHDASGRVVARVADGLFAAGRHDLQWSGRDDAGRRVPAGVYFVRLENCAGIRSSKIAVVR